MDYLIRDSEIIVNNIVDFDPKHILECGQVFRFAQEENIFKIYTKNLFCVLIKDKSCVIIKTAKEDIDYFVNYFDLNNNYSSIKNDLLKIKDISSAITFGQGIRILNQDPLETVISFIISANNNIPRIKKIIERLCKALGAEKENYFAFPTLEALASVDVQFFRDIGAGYRADYLVKTIKMLKDGFDLESIYNMPSIEARKKLTTLYGVGEKVADCILLFGYHKNDVFPVDVWTERVFNYYYPDQTNISRSRKSQKLTELFNNYSGYAQQYLFYYFREIFNNIVEDEKWTNQKLSFLPTLLA